MIPLLFAIYDAIIVPTWAPVQKRGEKKKYSTITIESFMRHFYTFLQHICLKHLWICFFFTCLYMSNIYLYMSSPWASFCLFFSHYSLASIVIVKNKETTLNVINTFTITESERENFLNLETRENNLDIIIIIIIG